MPEERKAGVMKSLFRDNRVADILALFYRASSISISALASRFNVSERTVRNDIKQLNEELKKCAVIDGKQGKYSLHIFDRELFQKVFTRILETDEHMNSCRNRMDYIFGRLMRSEMPVLTDELAYEMNVGRTTLIADLKKLRAQIEPYRLVVIGKTSKGLVLGGAESDIRQYVLENCYEQIYCQYPLDSEIVDVIEKALTQASFGKTVQKNFRQFVTLMLDRFLTGHYIGALSSRYYDLTMRPAFQFVDKLVDEIGDILQIRFLVEEKLFVMLPIIGMRTPADIRDMKMMELDQEISGLLSKVFDQIYARMEIRIWDTDFTEEFLYHLMFMINRLRFGVRLVNPMLGDLKEKYPLAYQMAGIAAEVVCREYGLEVTEDERGYLASYFGVFLTENDIRQNRRFRVAVICGTGRVTARLVAAQLKNVLDSSVEMKLYADSEVTEELLDQYDIILTTVRLPCSSERPVIWIHEIFDERELRHKLGKIKYWDQIDVPVLDDNWFIMTGLLDESRFFRLESKWSYEEALCRMVDGLMENGQVDEEFMGRLQEREKKGTMVFDSVAIPHSVQYANDRLVLSIGVCSGPIRHQGSDIRVVFLIGLPRNVGEDDDLLIRVYDEMIHIARDKELLDGIASADSLPALLRVLYRKLE